MGGVLRALTIGTFDLPHLGHAAFFRRCERYGELLVGVNTDEFVERYKGQRPLFSLSQRLGLIQSLGYRTEANASAGRMLVEGVRPDVLVIGSDWLERDYLAQIDMTRADFDRLDIDLIYVPYTAGISTTIIRDKVRAGA